MFAPQFTVTVVWYGGEPDYIPCLGLRVQSTERISGSEEVYTGDETIAPSRDLTIRGIARPQTPTVSARKAPKKTPDLSVLWIQAWYAQRLPGKSA